MDFCPTVKILGPPMPPPPAYDNLFNKGIMLNCIVFWNNILTCLRSWHFDYISLILVKSSGIWQHAQWIDIYRRKIYFCWSNLFNKWGEIATWKYQIHKFDYHEHQDFVGILSLHGLHMPAVCLHYHCLQLLMHTFFCE